MTIAPQIPRQHEARRRESRFPSRLGGGPFAAPPPVIRLYDAEPDLFAGRSPEALPEAQIGASARVIALDPGPWPAELDLEGDRDQQLGLLVVDGLLLRSLRLGRTVRSELLGQGDLIRPWQRDEEDATTPMASRWDA